ncbi:anti-sigma factor [Halomonas campisalis]|uniref:Anti-sigma factor n=1 Tax=Billgrantia campisalis TaxID=74661 RepID=A0ABS9PAK8_9GAMM|nr:zf-HC2 domain-containing protein [Halomonas campisalis]MCG6658170.1 anti-sigma factor [Halomonas campisalis]MDR5862839.1 zf-HC2 domain-containing protein [Halomonas campisalis]
MSARDLNCEEVIERLFDYLDQELDAQQAADIDRHLHRCRDCFTRSEFEKRLRARVAAAGTASAPPRLQRRIRHLLDQFNGDESDTTR